MVDTSLLITIALIFLVSLIGAYIRTTLKDPCLKSFHDFHVTLERTNGKVIWGVMHLAATGLELRYPDAVQDEKHVESSYILYASEYGDIQTLYRYADQLSEWGKRKRKADIARSFHPNLLRRLARSTRNFLSTATDSLNEVLGRVQKAGSHYLSEKTDVTLGKLGGKVLGQVGGSIYDPLLERFIGQRVVIELQEGNEVHEHVGIFKNYSANFIEILDIQYPQRRILPVALDGAVAEAETITAHCEGSVLKVFNHSDLPVLVQSLECAGQEQLVNAIVDGGEVIVVHPNQPAAGQARLHLQAVRELDMVVPRSRCVVRHRAENYQPEAIKDVIFDIIFDVGLVFETDRRQDVREERLREELKHNSADALAAANLAGLLIQRQAYPEAEKWLRLALGMEQSLPDGGRRARMQLRELARQRGDKDSVTSQ
jgi:small nuclear ribonucleoprotein (snRNP)-like protein